MQRLSDQLGQSDQYRLSDQLGLSDLLRLRQGLSDQQDPYRQLGL